VDGRSTDNTVDILRIYERYYDLKRVSEPDDGQSDAVNKEFRMAKAEIVGWLNSDDVCFEWLLEHDNQSRSVPKRCPPCPSCGYCHTKTFFGNPRPRVSISSAWAAVEEQARQCQGQASPEQGCKPLALVDVCCSTE
jgi:hypothetical protein